jgi:3'(2'), 5'-bisphosphate nucleotidase
MPTPVPAASLTWALELLAIEPAIAPGAWWLYRAALDASAGGYAHAAAKLWSPGGRLAALSRQSVAVCSGESRSPAMNWRDDLDLALRLALEAGVEALRLYDELPLVADAPADISTAADHAVQAILVDALLRERPGDGILAEEATLAALPSPRGRRHWSIDPIDGSRGFARKNGEYAIQLALVEEGRPVVGVVFEPAPGRLTWAARGAGCWVRRDGGEPVAASVSATRGRPAVLAISRSRKPEQVAALLAGFGAQRAVATYSAGIKLAQVARGEADLYLGDYLGLHDWDVAPGHLLVEEAGGRVTDVDGGEVRYDGGGRSLRGRGVLASNGHVHAAAVAAFAAGGVPIS